MRKMMLMAALLALILAAAIPAAAQVAQEIGQETESGEVAVEFEAASEGDYAQQCVAPLQFGNTGNLQNAQGFTQYASTADDIESEGSSFVFEPEVSTECNQAVQQSAAATSTPEFFCVTGPGGECIEPGVVNPIPPQTEFDFDEDAPAELRDLDEAVLQGLECGTEFVGGPLGTVRDFLTGESVARNLVDDGLEAALRELLGPCLTPVSTVSD